MAQILCILTLLLTVTCIYAASLREQNQTRYVPVKTLQGQFDFYVEENTLDEMKEMKEHIEDKLEENKKYIEKLISTSIVELTKNVATQAEEMEELEINVKALRESLADKLDENDRKIAWAITDGSLAPRNTSWVQENFRKLQQQLDEVLTSRERKTCDAVLTSGVMRVTPVEEQPSYTAMCLVRDNRNWMVFQRRYDGSLDFYRDWEDYAHGFGNVDGEHWLGLRYLHKLSTRYNLQLRVEMILFTEPKTTYYAQYSSFSIGSEKDGFPLTVGGYSGNAGDSLIGSHNGRRFGTKDRDNSHGCIARRHGAWWHNNCGNSNLNGRYTSKTDVVDGWYQHLLWRSLKREGRSALQAGKFALKASTMMVRMVF